MRTVYIPDKNTYKLYADIFKDQRGSGLDGSYFYSAQNGGGLGGFLRNLFKFAAPIGRKLVYKGYEIARPELHKIAASGADALSRVAEQKVQQISQSAQRRLNSIGRKRKADALGKV